MITVRKANLADVSTIVSFIEKKAAFDRALGCFDGTLSVTSERIAKGLFGATVFAHALIATSESDPVGFAFYHFRFSSFQARPSLWLDDLYVDLAARRSGAGSVLMGALATAAAEHDCTHISWSADARNPSGVPFYRKIGATLSSEHGSRLGFSITPEHLTVRITEISQT